MKDDVKSAGDDMSALADDARGLLNATADVAGAKVAEARQRLSEALERGKQIYGRVREKAVDGAKVADEAITTHPYEAIAIGVGVGALIGYLLASRCSNGNNRD